MNSLTEISKKILECSQNDRLEILISLRAFLLECQDCPWIHFKDPSNFSEDLFKVQNHNFEYFKSLNEQNIKKINIQPIELILLPRNKKNTLLNLLDDLNYNNSYLVFDLCRTNPFSKDLLFDFILSHKDDFNKETIKIYEARNKSIKSISEFAKIENNIYETSLCTSRKNKIKDYWINIWGIKDKYIFDNQSSIENLIL